MRRSLRQVLQPPRKLRFTSEGRWFVGMTLMVGFGAVNTGNNLLYLLLGMMLGLIIVSGMLSESVLRGLTIRRVATGDIFAGRPVPVSCEIHKERGWLSSYSITVSEHEARATRARRRVALGLPADVPRRRKAREAEQDPGPPTMLALRVPPGSTVLATGECTFPVRGLYRYVGLDIATRFPFGFFEKTRPQHGESELLVFPALLSAGSRGIQDPALDGEIERAWEGRSDDFFGLREFRHGDDRRDIHWKVSARRDQLIRRVYQKQDQQWVALHLYNWAPPARDPAADAARLAAVEQAISEAATLSVELARRDIRFSLQTLGEHVAEGSGPGQLRTVLRQLALMEVRRDAEPPVLPLARGGQRVLFAPDHAPAHVHAGFGAPTPHAA
jgi:uncharacterized protein (DUF58 family)